ncbi:hypothetical protein ABZ890_00965 [Streptomyces sp. NPDC046984]|uniref:hypothetical protein n=1 Tax=Streptomyces sp. NPDC046984 TaxID=3155138 RepID=UPI0033CDEC70
MADLLELFQDFFEKELSTGSHSSSATAEIRHRIRPARGATGRIRAGTGGNEMPTLTSGITVTARYDM